MEDKFLKVLIFPMKEVLKIMANIRRELKNKK